MEKIIKEICDKQVITNEQFTLDYWPRIMDTFREELALLKEGSLTEYYLHGVSDPPEWLVIDNRGKLQSFDEEQGERILRPFINIKKTQF